MAIEVLMPAMSATVRVGRLARWLVAPGDVVRPGDVLAEIETETATMEVEAVDGGRIARILIASGTEAVAADTPIALIETEGGTVRRLPQVKRGSEACGELQSRGRIKASPLARKRARVAGVALDELQGSGPGGRIIARDVAACKDVMGSVDDPIGEAGVEWRLQETSVVSLQHSSGRGPTRQLTSVPSALTGPTSDVDIVREAYAPGSTIARSHDSRWHMIVDRLAMAHTHVPQLTLHADVRFDELERALQRMNLGHHTSARRQLALTVSDVLVKAMGLGLRKVPEANVSFTRSAMLHHAGADVAVALLCEVGEDVDAWCAEPALGTLAPVIAHVDLKSLSEISAELRSLREMAQSGYFDTAAVRGGVATIYDLSGSMVGGLETLVMPPQSSVLVLGAAEAKAVVVDGVIGVHRCARMSLSVDQRAIDTRAAMRLLAVLKAYVEDPMRMLV